MLSMVTLNVNSIHDPGKWSDIWHELPQCDLICLQEMYLVPEQTYAFELFSQGYDWHYSFGTSVSAGIGIGVK